MKTHQRHTLFSGVKVSFPILQMNLVSGATSSANPSTFLKKQLKKELPALLKKYRGQLLDVKTFPSFQRNGAELYTQRGVYETTDIVMTLLEDVTQAHQAYQNHFSKESGATFSLYLFWTLLQSLNKVAGFNYRYIDDQWYNFENLPLFTTMQGANGELNNVLLEDVAQSSWKEFCTKSLAAKAKLESSLETTMYSYPVYACASHITNTKLNFTSIAFPAPKKGIEIERPMFLMGERQEKGEKLIMPLGVKLPHASLHPQLLDKLLLEWRGVRNAQLLKEGEANVHQLRSRL